LYFELVALRRRGSRVRPLDAVVRPTVIEELGEAASLAQLRGHALRVAPLLELDAGADPERVADHVAEVADALGEVAVSLDVWVQLPDETTRFLNTSTAEEMGRRIRPLVAALRARDTDVGLCLDMEPNEALLDGAFELMRPLAQPLKTPGALSRTVTGALRHRAEHRRGLAALTVLDEDLAAAGTPTHVAVLPPLSGLGRRGAGPRGRWLGCPPVGTHGRLLFGRQAAMVYTTLFRRLWGKADPGRERALLERYARWHFAFAGAHGAPLALALGMIGAGILTTEPTWETPEELAEQATLSSALGATDISVFCLEGLLYGRTGVPDDETSCAPTRAGRRTWWEALFEG
jgi:hypothetical protein